MKKRYEGSGSLITWAIAFAVTLCVAAPRKAQEKPLDAPFVPSIEELVEAMLKLAKVTKNDVVYDLGCGDGRIVIMAAKKFGARGVGVDIDRERIRESNRNARTAGVTGRVRFIRQDLFETDISKATVVTLYLKPEVNLKLRPKLLTELKPGTRVVSNTFDMGDWVPDKIESVFGNPIYFWIIPKKPAAHLRKLRG